MKSVTRKSSAMILLSALLLLSACKDRDVEIKSDLTAKAKESLEFAGVSFMVEGGVVTLNGSCPTADMRAKLNDKVKGLYGVKNLVSNLAVAPVVIGTDRALKLSVDSVLMEYPSVAATVVDSSVLLSGRVEQAKSAALLTAVQRLRPRALENRLTLK